MDNRFKNRVKTALRRLSWSWKPYNRTKDAAKVDKATFECAICGKYCYTGKSEKSLTDLKEKYKIKIVEMESVCVDHIDPVEDPIKGWQGWDSYIERLYCEEDNLQICCVKCHKEKSKEEQSIRRKNK